MRLYEVVVPLATLALILFAVRWQFNHVVEKAVSGNPTIGIPIGTPITAPLCGYDNRNCKNLNFDHFNTR